METTGTIPTGAEMLATLIDLLADQEGVKITYTIERKEHGTDNNNETQRLQA